VHIEKPYNKKPFEVATPKGNFAAELGITQTNRLNAALSTMAAK
jgi:hypothetical protein